MAHGYQGEKHFVFCGLAALLGLEVIADGIAQHRMAKIFLAVEDIGDGCIRPKVRVMVSVISRYHTFFLFPIRGWDQNFLGSKRLPDCADRCAVRCHSEDTLHNRGGLRVNEEGLVIRIQFVAIGNRATASLAMLHAVAEDGLDLLGRVPGIPFVHDIEEWRKFVLGRAVAVDIVVDGNEADSLLREEDLRIKTHLKVVPADSRHVLDAYYRHIPRLDLFQKSLEARAVEIRAGVAIIGKMADIPETFGSGIVFQILFLIGYTCAFTLKLVILGKSAIDSNLAVRIQPTINFCLYHFHHHYLDERRVNRYRYQYTQHSLHFQQLFPEILL